MSETAQETQAKGRSSVIGVVRLLRDFGILIFLLGLVVYLAIASDVFLSTQNFRNVLDAAVPMGLVAIGGTLVIIAGGFDLSAGAILTVGAVVSALASNAVSPTVGVLAGLGAGAALGLLNGLIVTVGRVNAFVATLGTSILYGGFAVAISGSSVILVKDRAFSNVARTDVLGVSSATVMLVVAAVAVAFLLNRTVVGRRVFGVGGNLVAARLAGVPVARTIAATYVVSGLLAGLAGVIITSRSLTVGGTSGGTIIFDALAAILIGGNSVLGGEGAIWRTSVGVLILALIANGTNLLGVDPLYQKIISGGIILVAVGLDARARRSG